MRFSLTVDQLSKHPLRKAGTWICFVVNNISFRRLSFSLLDSLPGYPAKYQLILEEMCLTKFFHVGQVVEFVGATIQCLVYPHMIFLISCCPALGLCGKQTPTCPQTHPSPTPLSLFVFSPHHPER